MKRFLITGVVLLLLVLLLAVSVFAYIQHQLLTGLKAESTSEVVENAVPGDQARSSVGDTKPATVSGEAEAEPEPPTTDADQTDAPAPVLTEPIPLARFPLTEGQKSLLRGAGIDPDTFVVTPAMVTCAQDRLGEQRFSEIIAGDAPSPTEVFTLLRCL
jgi:hypothetical protein